MTEEVQKVPLWLSFFRTFKMVAWSFLGIRKRSEFHKDVAQVNPVQVVVVGVVSGVLFVIGLVVVVNLIV
jgi:hypothetical protein